MLHATATTPPPVKNTVAAIEHKLRGKPVNCAAINWPRAFKTLDRTMATTKNTSPINMMRVSRTVSASCSPAKPA